jgi:hypothetical protein|tara:strand:+ start:36 stop:269 length:234 start_codon:yes stop_codon:yes gene_type:complete
MVLRRGLFTLESEKKELESAGTIEMKKNKDYKVRVNICWEVGEEKKCVTLSKDEAYATREWVDEQGGVVFWFQPLPD